MTTFRHFFCAAVLALAAAGAHAQGSAYDAVQTLLAQGNSAQAVQRAEEYLAANPQDAQMRFILAGALAAAGREGDAQTLLRQMCDDYPELAEPWNNLAVLHAAAGRLDEAAGALQEALRRNPDYATALDNLGEVRVRQAYEAWQRAVTLDAGLRVRLLPQVRALQVMTAPEVLEAEQAAAAVEAAKAAGSTLAPAVPW